MDSILKQLVRNYYDHEWWQGDRLPLKEAYKYHSRLLDSGNIIVYGELGVLLGYLEFWRINFEQFGRVVCKAPFAAYLEDILNGNIAYVANIWIDPNFRKGRVMKTLKLMFFKQNYHCDYYVGEALRKKTNLVKVFKREDLSSKLFREGVKDGQEKRNNSS